MKKNVDWFSEFEKQEFKEAMKNRSIVARTAKELGVKINYSQCKQIQMQYESRFGLYFATMGQGIVATIHIEQFANLYLSNQLKSESNPSIKEGKILYAPN